MAKKKLILNESTTRQFMKYANIKPSYVSNFLREAEEMEDEDMMGEEPAAEEMEVEMEPEMDAGMETEDEMEMSGGDLEGDLMDLMKTIADWAKERGVNMQVEGDEEEMEEPEGGDMGASTDLGDAEADLDAADVEVEEPAASEEEVIAEVTRRVARRLLRESAKQKRR